ncbi:uncharacterized protein [Coffea arabica]|uniref:Uncharacterized protein isoform X2 n=1 Tax=Coffea arabica TaxID=13443 RepID=A0ABM4WTM0_COFAR
MARLRARKPQRDAPILKAKKRKKPKRQREVLKTNNKPASSLLRSSDDHEQNLESHQKPCLDITLPSQILSDFDPKSFSKTQPIQSMPSSPKTLSHLAIVPFNNPSLKAGTVSSRKKGKSLMTCHWNKKKMETLTKHFNPIPFSPKRVPSLDIASNQSLLSTLGLWDFFHLDFDQELRTDLIKELVVFYNSKRHPYCKSYVNGLSITLSRGALAKALHLPLKSRSRRSLVAKGGGEDGLLMLSEEEGLFLEEIVWGWLVLQDDGSMVIEEVLKFTRCVRERMLEEVDWAGLIWFMVERELSKGQDLVNCYYASHMQILLKHQLPKLFESEDVENVIGEEAHLLDVPVENVLGEESNLLDLQMVDVEDSRNVDKQVIFFDEEFSKESVASVVKDAWITEIGQEDENILVKCYKRRTQYLEKCRKERKLCMVDDVGNTIAARDCEGEEIENQQNDVYLLDGEFGNEQQIKGVNHDQHEYELQSMNEEDEKVGENADELKGDEMDHQQGNLSCMPANERKDLESSSYVGMLKNLDKAKVSTEIVSSGMDHLNWRERDNQQFNVAAKQENGERKSSLEVSEEGVKDAVNMLMNEETHEEGLKTEQLTDLTVSGVDVTDIQGMENQQTCLVSNQENGEKRFGIEGSLEEEQHVRAESILDEQHAAQTEPGIELTVVQGEKEVEEMEGLAEEPCKVETDELLDNGEKVMQKVDLCAAKHNTSHENALKEGVNQEGHATQTEPGNEWMVVQREREAEGMEGLAKEVCEAEIGELLDKTENAMQNVDLSAEKPNIFHENALEEGVNQEETHLRDSLKRSEEENIEPESMDVNEFLRADVVSKQITLNARTCKGGSDHHIETTEEDIICLEHEENDKREQQLCKSNASEDSVLQQCAPTNVEVCEIHKGKIQVVETNISNDLPMEVLAKEICEAEIHKLLDNRENVMQNIQVDLKADKHVILQENVLGEEENQEGMNSSKSCGENVGVDATVWNEILGADNDNIQVTLNAEPSKGGSEYVTETKRGDVMYLEHEENDKRKFQLSESNISERLVLQNCTPGDVEVTEVHKEKIQVVETNISHDPPRECTSIEDLYSAQGVQSTCENEMRFSAPNNNFNHSFIELPTPNLDVQIGELIPSVHTEAQQSRNVHPSATSLENFESQPDIGMNMGGSSFDNSIRSEICSLNYSQYEHVTESQKRARSDDAENNEPLDLELCTRQMEVWMSRLKNAAKKRARADGEISTRLLRKIEEQNKIIEEQNKMIQQHEKLKNEEQQKKQKGIRRYERELRLMQGVLSDYRRALKEVDKSYSKYRERCQLPEEPLYMDDPCGGGKVILAAEFNKLSLESQNKATQVSIEGMMKNFMHEWVDKFEEYFIELDHLCHRLEDVEISVSSLKGKVLNAQDPGT